MDEKNKYSETSQFVVLQHIATDNTCSKVTQVKGEWFYGVRHKITFKILKDYPGIDVLKFIEISKNEKSEFFSTDYITDLFTGSHYGFEEAVSIIRTKYNQRLTEEKLSKMLDIIYDTSDITEAEVELGKHFRDLDTESEKFRSLDSEFNQDNNAIIEFSENRGLNLLIPKRRSITTIGGDSSHHKTNQLIDVLLDSLIHNFPKNPRFKVLMFSGEEEFDDIRSRIFAKLLHIDSKDIIKRNIRVGEVLEEMKEKYPYVFTNFAVIGPEEFKTGIDVARIVNSFSPDVWGLDFIQWFAQTNAGGNFEMNRNVMESVANIVAVSKASDSMVVILSQIRKKDKTAVIQFPRVDDLEWSGLIKQLSRNIGICFWPYKIKPGKVLAAGDKATFILSWKKVRYGEPFNEFLNVFPEFCDFKKMDKSLIKNREIYLDW